MKKPRFIKARYLCLVIVGLLFSINACMATDGAENQVRLPGEFESQRAVMVSVSDWQPHHRHILTDLISKTSGHIPLLVLFNDRKQLRETLEHLDSSAVNYQHVLFHELDLDTVWLRDFGPRIAQSKSGKACSIDFYYNGVRPKDDKFPKEWAKRIGAEFEAVPWTLQGGNLISNGKGLSVTTNRIFEDNYIRFAKPRGMNVEYERRKIVLDAFKESCNIKQMVVLEPLQSENTKHVDMFAMFLASNKILVSQLDPRRDPINAQILNRNAQKLASLKVDGKPMIVERIAIPPREGKFWSPYTNTILTDDLLLFPTYRNDHPSYVENAKRVFKRLLPRHKIKTIDMTSMKKLEGALHCLSLNVPAFCELPASVMTPEEARQYLLGKLIAGNKTVKQKASNPVADKSSGANAASSSGWQAKKVVGDTKSEQADSANHAAEKRRRLAAIVETYLRNFVAVNGQSVDAYPVKVTDDQVNMIRADNRKEIQIKLSLLSERDRKWLDRNRETINIGGPKVKRYLGERSKSAYRDTLPTRGE